VVSIICLYLVIWLVGPSTYFIHEPFKFVFYFSLSFWIDQLWQTENHKLQIENIELKNVIVVKKNELEHCQKQLQEMVIISLPF
jgi:hypothetical protein